MVVLEHDLEDLLLYSVACRRYIKHEEDDLVLQDVVRVFVVQKEEEDLANLVVVDSHGELEALRELWVVKQEFGALLRVFHYLQA